MMDGARPNADGFLGLTLLLIEFLGLTLLLIEKVKRSRTWTHASVQRGEDKRKNQIYSRWCN